MFSLGVASIATCSKFPLNQNEQISVFQLNTTISKPSQVATFDVTSGYPYKILEQKTRFEFESGGFIFVPPNINYNKTISTSIDIIVNQSTIKTTDISTGAIINISQSALNAAFDKHINKSINETLDVSVNTSIQCTDTVDIIGQDTAMTYEILWQKQICTMSIQLGEIQITFDVPKNKSFAGLREVKTNSEKKLFNTVGIALTRQCTAECDMCCFKCGPDKTEQLDKKIVFSIIEQAAQIPEIEKIGFTGGEATLCNDLIEYIKQVKIYQMSPTLTSNGHWGNTLENATKWLNDLKQAGLYCLTISVDEYHQKYVPIEYIKNIIHANKQVNLFMNLAVGDSLNQRNASEIIKELGQDIYEIPVLVYPFMAIGRGKTLDNVLMQKLNPNWECKNNRMLSILYDGSVFPCCSQAVYESKISEGNIYNTSLKDIIDKYKYFSVFAQMKKHNFKWLIDKANEYNIPVSEEYHSPCDFCNQMFSNEDFVKKLRDNLAKETIQNLISIL